MDEAIKALQLHLGVLESAGWGDAPLANALRTVLPVLVEDRKLNGENARLRSALIAAGVSPRIVEAIRQSDSGSWDVV